MILILSLTLLSWTTLTSSTSTNPTVPTSTMGFNPRTPVTWSNRLGLTLTPITTGVWAAERPFMWNNIDVGGRSVIARMADGNLMVHSPVEWTEELGML
jgi:hypothetical protein